jgi:ribosomal protein L37AE/L43A
MFERESKLRALAYLIVLCRYCGTPRYVRESEKGFKCVKCGSYVVLSKAQVITTRRSALKLLKELGSEYVRIERRLPKLGEA